MAHVKTNRFSGNRAVRTLGAFTLGAAMTVGDVSFASAGDVQPTPNEVQALGYNTLIFQDEFTGNELDTSKWGYEYSCFDPKTRSQAQYTDSKENASVSGGNLHLTAKYEPTRQKYDSRSRSMVTSTANALGQSMGARKPTKLLSLQQWCRRATTKA